MNINEGNKLIDEFMGIEYDDGNDDDKKAYYNYVADSLFGFNDEYFNCKERHYHESWDLLIPVYEKVTRLAKKQNVFQDGYPGTGGCNINWGNQRDLYANCIKFIKWYNNKTK